MAGRAFARKTRFQLNWTLHYAGTKFSCFYLSRESKIGQFEEQMPATEKNLNWMEGTQEREKGGWLIGAPLVSHPWRRLLNAPFLDLQLHFAKFFFLPNSVVKMFFITTLFILPGNVDVRFFLHTDGPLITFSIIAFVTIIIKIVMMMMIKGDSSRRSLSRWWWWWLLKVTHVEAPLPTTAAS